jgi:hypothetical protein
MLERGMPHAAPMRAAGTGWARRARYSSTSKILAAEPLTVSSLGDGLFAFMSNSSMTAKAPIGKEKPYSMLDRRPAQLKHRHDPFMVEWRDRRRRARRA